MQDSQSCTTPTTQITEQFPENLDSLYAPKIPCQKHRVYFLSHTIFLSPHSITVVQ